ncbi:hypothetical protein CBS147344_5697 [Aspergillus niger]|nr:hypothetical protein CBS147344_5697 [Aspergillus niger]
MRPNDTSHGLSSPISTNDIGSANGSPDTKLTAYSPEDMRSICLRSDTSVGDTLGDIGARKLYLASSSDPFLASTNTSTRVQLSPTAASFTPIGTADNASIRSKAPSLSRGFSGAGYLTASSDIDPCEARNGPLQASDRFSLKYGVIGNSQADTRDHPVIRDYETFGSESHSRALVIENVPKNLTYMSLAGFFNRREFSSLRGPVLSELSSMGKVYVAFTDSREAAKAIEKVKVLRPEWHVSTIAPKEYVKHVEPSLLPQTSNYEGQLLVTVYYDGRNPNLNQHTIARSLETLSMTFGDIKTFASLPIEQENIGEFHIEYFNTRDADNVLTTLNGTSVDRRPIDIIDFVNARAGRTWNCFNSDKVAEVSYASQLYKEKIVWCKGSVTAPSCWNIRPFDQRFFRPAQVLSLAPRIAFLDQTTLRKCAAALKMRNMLDSLLRAWVSSTVTSSAVAVLNLIVEPLQQSAK